MNLPIIPYIDKATLIDIRKLTALLNDGVALLEMALKTGK